MRSWRLPRAGATLKRVGFFAAVVLAAAVCGTGEPGDLAIIGPSLGRPATIAFDSGAVTINSGATLQLVPVVRDSAGARLTSPSGVTWTSSNEAVATVNASGVVTGISGGISDIRATINTGSVDRVAILRVTVVGGGTTPPPPPPPGGELPTGVPAKVTITPDTVSLNNGQTVVLRGRIFDANGTQIRGTFYWSISRLDTGVVRVSADVGDTVVVTSVRCCLARVIGATSGGIRDTAMIASGQGPVTSIVARAPFIGLNPGDQANITGYAKLVDNDGDVVVRPMTYRVANAAIATVGADGTMRAVSAGETTITFASEGKTMTMPVRVRTGNPNQPDNTETVTDRPFNGFGEDWDNFETRFPSTLLFAPDPSAPRSPSSVATFVYPAGFVGGVSPATMQRRYIGASTPTPGTAFQASYVVVWLKLSDNWVGNPTGTNKLFFLWTGNPPGPSIFFSAEGAGAGPLQAQFRIQGVPDARARLAPNATDAYFQRGKWHRLELFVRMNTGGLPNGVARWWLDGTLVGSYEDVNFLPAGVPTFDQIQISPIWGGNGGLLTVEQRLSVDHIFLGGIR